MMGVKKIRVMTGAKKKKKIEEEEEDISWLVKRLEIV